MSIIQIAIVNASTVVRDADVPPVLQALQLQVMRDFAPAWGTDADLRICPKGERIGATEWALAILDDSDQAGALGYHDLTADGMPMGKVFAKTDMQYNEAWPTTASHELLEMLADPWIFWTVFDDMAARIYAGEVCDAVEAQSYSIGDVAVSNFVLPSWFEPFRAEGSVRFDFLGRLIKPFELAAGGYISYYDLNAPQGWKQALPGGQENIRARPPVGSRRERRAVPRAQWMRSCHTVRPAP